MATYKIPVTWESYGIVTVEAKSLKAAIDYFDENRDDIGLPDNPEYVDGSFDRADDELLIKTLNKKT